MAAESIRGSAELSGSSGASGVLGGDSRSRTHRGRLMGFARHGTRQGSTWMDHVRSEGYVTRADVTWDFRGGRQGRLVEEKVGGDGWDRYNHALPKELAEHASQFPSVTGTAGGSGSGDGRRVGA